MEELGRVDYEDTFSVHCPEGISATDVLLGFFSSTPKIVVTLMRVRNAAVSLFGLKAQRRPDRLDASMMKPGSRIGLFEVGAITTQSAVIGADDSHLNFRVFLNIQQQVLSCTTRVTFNNSLGRVYFFFVKPFHELIVPAMLRAAVRHVTPRPESG